jgi:M6 family metalloprotease-like protein
MNRRRGLAFVVSSSLLFLVLSSSSGSASQITSTNCAKAGTFRTSKNVRYQCKKTAQGLRWVKASKPVTPITSTNCAKAGTFRTSKNVRYQCKKTAQGLRWVKASKPVTPINRTTTTATTTTSTTIPLYSDPEITDVKYLLNLQECQIRDATPSSDVSSGFPRLNSLRSGFGQLEVLVIPVNFTDLTFGATDAKAMEAAYTKVNSFYSAMSYGKAAVKMTLAQSSSWVEVGGTVEQNGHINTPPQTDGSIFYRKVIEIYLRNNIISGYDVVDVVSAYSTRFSGGQGMPPGSNSIYGTGKSFAGTQVFGQATQRWDVIAHELGHAWLAFEDLYLFKGGAPLGQWDMMSSSGAEFSGWSRFLAGWIEPNWVRCANPRTPTRHYLSALNADTSDDKPRILVLPLNSQSALIAELRTPTVWQTNIKSPTLVVYRVDTGIAHGNGPITLIGTTDQTGGTISTDGIKITVKGLNSSGVIVDVGN